MVSFNLEFRDPLKQQQAEQTQRPQPMVPVQQQPPQSILGSSGRQDQSRDPLASIYPTGSPTREQSNQNELDHTVSHSLPDLIRHGHAGKYAQLGALDGHYRMGHIVSAHRPGEGGGNYGFDPEKPQTIKVDPIALGAESSLDMSLIDNDMVNQAYEEAARKYDDPRKRGSYAYIRLMQMVREGRVGKPREPVAEYRPEPEEPQVATQSRPGSNGTARNGQQQQPPPRRQQSITDAVRSSSAGRPQQQVQLSQPGGGGPRYQVTMQPPKPAKGDHTCFYHDVIQSDERLILVYDHSTPTQYVFFPSPIDDDESAYLEEMVATGRMEESQIQERMCWGVRIHDVHETAPDVLLIVLPTETRFRYQNLEFCVTIVQEVAAPQPPEPDVMSNNFIQEPPYGHQNGRNGFG